MGQTRWSLADKKPALPLRKKYNFDIEDLFFKNVYAIGGKPAPVESSLGRKLDMWSNCQ